MLCVSAAYTIAWCPSVRLSLCLSVTFVYYVKRVNIFSIFSPSGSHIILVFRIKRCGDILTGTSLSGAKFVIFDHICLWHRSLLYRHVSSTFRRWTIGYSTYASSVSRCKCQQKPPPHAACK